MLEKKEYQYQAAKNKEYQLQNFVQRSKILVLDEATSNLDLETEKLIHSLSSLKEPKKLSYMLHRVSSLKLCDKIYTINQNKKLIQLEQ